jgi:hypothetical protein
MLKTRNFKKKPGKIYRKIGGFKPADFFYKNKFCPGVKMCKFAIPFGEVCKYIGI